MYDNNILNGEFYILRKAEVLKIIPISKTTMHNMINQGLFPTSIPLGDRSIGFSSIEIQKWIDARFAGFNNEQIKELVERMLWQRKKSKSWLFKEIYDKET